MGYIYDIDGIRINLNSKYIAYCILGIVVINTIILEYSSYIIVATNTRYNYTIILMYFQNIF